MVPGLYVTFFKEGESFESELPPVGPLEHLVVRDRSLVADRKDVDHVDHSGGGSRWIEAELELQRAIGNESGGARRPALRIGAPQGVYLRFVSFGDATEDEPVPELGPYAVVVVTPQRVEGDGDVLAIRSGSKQPWELTRVGGPALAGLFQPDIAFRTRSTDYHPRTHPARRRVRSESKSARHVAPPTLAHPVARPVQPKQDSPLEKDRFEPRTAPDAVRVAEGPPTIGRSTPPQTATADVRPLSPELGASLRSRLGGDVLTRPRATTASERANDRRVTNRRLALLAMGALVIGLVAFGALRSSPTTSSGSVVGVGKLVTGPHWDYTVATVSRASQVSSAVARGVYLIVWVTASKRDASVASLSPRDFALADASGGEYAPLTESDLVYRSDGNPGSPLTWMTSYAVNQPVSTPVIFDVAPTLRGVQLIILDVPAIRVRLD